MQGRDLVHEEAALILWLVMLKTSMATEVWQRRQGLAAWQVFNGASATWQAPSQTLTDTTLEEGTHFPDEDTEAQSR